MSEDQLQPEDSLDDRGVDDVLDEGFSPPEKLRGSEDKATTALGELEGETIEDYRAWKRGHGRGDAFPGGESLDAAALRYADACERLLERREQRILVVCHEIPVRYAVNAATGSDELDGPAHEIENCVPHLFDEDGLARAAARIRALVG